MSFLTRLFGKGKKNLNLEVTRLEKKEPEQQTTDSGTTIRKPKMSELTAPEMTQKADWKVKALPEWKPGDVILDTYEVEDVISGGMGHVYIANHNKWKVKLAIKSPNEMMLSDRDFFARILREANFWIELGLHPNIAYCYYVRNIEDVPHIIVEYVDGGNLREWIEDGKCIDYRTNLDLAIQFCHGMEHAHSKGMIHRDIKPENVLMTKDGIVKITDFGLVRQQDGGFGDSVSFSKNDSKPVAHGLTTIGTRMGTQGYMAPEQEESARDVDERADIFSFGVCLYEMFCGNKPYKITYGPKQEPPDPTWLSGDKDFPNDIASVLTKCVQWVSSNRYQRFKEIRYRLVEIYKRVFSEVSPYADLDLVDFEADGLNNQGVAYFELGRKDDAIECWEKTLKINQTHLEATYNLSLIQWREGKLDDLEVPRRLDNCENNPLADKERLAELKAYIHAERCAPEDAKDLLSLFPGRYEEIFAGANKGPKKCLRTTIEEHTGKIASVAITPDGRHAVSGGWNKNLRVWELETGKCIYIMKGQEGPVYSIVITPDSRYAVSGGMYKTMRIWDIETGQCLQTMKLHPYDFKSVSLTPDGRYAIVVGNSYGSEVLQKWDLESGQCLSTMKEKEHTVRINSVAITPDSLHAVSGGWNKNLRLWDLETGECVRIMEGHSGGITSVALTPDGRYAVSAGLLTLRVWDLETDQCVYTMKGHTGEITSVSITPGGRYAVSGSGDKTLRKWDLETGQCVSTMEGHTDTVNSVYLTPDGRYAVSKGDQGTRLRFWDLENGQCLRTMKGHTGEITSVSITPDGRYAVSGSKDKTLRMWSLETDNSYQAETMVSLPKGYEQRKKEEKSLNEAIFEAEELYVKEDYGQAFATLYKGWEDIGFSQNDKIQRLYSGLMEKGRIKGLAFSFQKKVLTGHEDNVSSVSLTPDGR